jgi:transcriptional regulator with XRE-family HTH domain
VPTNKDLGRALRRLRRSQRRTIEAVAFAADIHPTYLSGIERGRRNPTWDKITALAQALGVTVVVLAQTVEDEAEVARAVRETRARIEARCA